MPEAATAPTPAIVPPASPVVVPRGTEGVSPSPARQAISNAFKKAAEAGPNDASKPKPAPTAPEPAPEPAKPAAAATPEPAKGKEAPATPETTPEPAKGQPGAPAKGKESPWKIVETYKTKLAQTERELAEVRKQVVDPQAAEKAAQRFAALEARNKELEEEMHYVNFSKTTEFKEKYQAPYLKAWQSAMADLRELTITDADGGTRPANEADMARLANMSLGDARRAATEMFGDSADDVMAHRRAIRELSDKQQEALDTARKQGGEREQTRTAQQEQIRSEVAALFEQARAAAEEKHAFLKPIEGDNDWNATLAEAKKLVDEVLRTKAGDPNLTPEQRADAVRKFVGIRNRAIGFFVLQLKLARQEAENASLKEQLKGYTNAEPGAGGGQPSDSGAASLGGEGLLDRIHAEMRRRAR